MSSHDQHQADGGDDGAANRSSSSKEERLREELETLQKQFDDWKQRARAGVDKQREQIADYAARIEMLQGEKEKLLAASMTSPGPVEEGVGSSSLSKRLPELLLSQKKAAWFQLMSCREDSFSLCTTLLRRTSTHQIESTVSLQAQHERYKKRAEMTIRMNDKNQHALEEERDRLKQELERLHDSEVSVSKGVKQRDLTIEALSEQLEAAHETIGSLEHRFAELEVNGEGEEEQRAMGKRIEEEMVEVRRELDSRMAAVVEQHREEMTGLVARHEEEIQELSQHVTMLRGPSNDNKQGGGGVKASSSSSTTLSGRKVMSNDDIGDPYGDRAYMELVKECDELQRKYDAEREEKQLAQDKLRELMKEYGIVEVVSSGDEVAGSSSGAHKRGQKPRKMKTMLKRKTESGGGSGGVTQREAELEKHVKQLSEQLWAAKAQAIELRSSLSHYEEVKNYSAGSGGGSISGGVDDNRSSTHASTASTIGAQQPRQHQAATIPKQHLTHVKAVLVKFLAMSSDKEDAKSSMIPVLSTLLEFSEDDLRTVYSANPAWIRR